MTNKFTLIALALLLTAVSANAQMNVGSTAVANSGAILDVSNINAVSSTYKGVLLPLVSLTATTVYGLNTANSPTPVNGMLVYNKQAAGSGATAVIVGAYIWQANAWNMVMFPSTLQGETTRASLAEKATADSLVTEINGRTAAVSILTATTASNVASINANLVTTNNNLSTETGIRQMAQTTETTRATNAENTTSATVASLQTSVTNEITNRNTAISNIYAGASTSISLASLQASVNSTNTAITNIYAGASTSVSLASLQTSANNSTSNLATTNNNLASLQASVNNSTSNLAAATNNITLLQSSTNNITSNLNNEIANRIAAITTEETVEFAATTAQTSFTLTHAPSNKSVIKMFIKGILISKTAHSNSGTTETYNPVNNGGSALFLNDRVQIIYNY